MSSASRLSAVVRHHLLPLVGLTALFGWMFARFLIHDWYLSDSDLYDYFLPAFLSPIHIWSSYDFSGLPAFADPGNFTYYLPNLVLGQWGGWNLVVISAYVLAAWFTYAYVYNLTRSRTASTVAALAYSMSESMLEGMAHLGAIHAVAWVPLIALAADRLRDTHRDRWIVVGVLAIANCILAGHPQPAIYAMYVLAAYALLGAIVERAGRRVYGAIATMFLLGAALAAIKLLPLVEASYFITRQQFDFVRFVGRVLTGPQTLSVLFPTIIHNDPREVPTYVGLVTLLLAIVSLAEIRRHWRMVFWTTVGAVAFLLALGTATPLVDLAYSVPLYDRFRDISRHLFLFAFAVSTLAGYGVAALQRSAVSRRAVARAVAVLLVPVLSGAAMIAIVPTWFEFETVWSEPGPGPFAILGIGIWIQVVIALSAAVLVLWMSRTGGTRLPAALLIVLLVTDLVSALPHNVLADGIEFTSIPSEGLRPSVHALALARALEPTSGRLLAAEGAHTDVVVPATFSRVWRIPVAGSYGPMLLERYARFASMMTNGVVNSVVFGERDVALDMLSVRYVLLNDGPAGETLRQELARDSRWRRAMYFRTSRTTDRDEDRDAEGEHGVAVYENVRALPRAWMVAETISLDDRAALNAIRRSRLPDESSFDPRHLAIAASDGPTPPRSFPPGEGAARILSVGDGEITVAATSSGGGFLVLAENFYPGWRARIDGQPSPIYRVNLTLRGLVVPPGTHRIIFTLESSALRAGIATSGGALMGCLMLLARDWRGRNVISPWATQR